MGMSVTRRAQSAPLPKPDDFLSEPFTCRGLGTAWACQVNVGQRRSVPGRSPPRPLQDSSRKTQRVQPGALRHFYASWCINPKVDGGLELPAKMVQERLGHANIAMTLDTCGHLCPYGDAGRELAEAELRLTG
jgi:hypothetical protein